MRERDTFEVKNKRHSPRPGFFWPPPFDPPKDKIHGFLGGCRKAKFMAGNCVDYVCIDNEFQTAHHIKRLQGKQGPDFSIRNVFKTAAIIISAHKLSEVN